MRGPNRSENSWEVFRSFVAIGRHLRSQRNARTRESLQLAMTSLWVEDTLVKTYHWRSPLWAGIWGVRQLKALTSSDVSEARGSLEVVFGIYEESKPFISHYLARLSAAILQEEEENVQQLLCRVGSSCYLILCGSLLLVWGLTFPTGKLWGWHLWQNTNVFSLWPMSENQNGDTENTNGK